MKIIEKPWGEERILEQNNFYVLKQLTMKKGHSCSQQYHENKTETIFILSGRLEIEIKGVKTIFNPNENVTIYPKEVHRMSGVDDCVYLEASTNHLDDVVRLKDNYDRV